MPVSVDKQYNLLSRIYDSYFGIGSLWLMKNLQRRAVQRLGLKKGDVVLDLGCGTGLLFGDLVRAVGETGKVIGIDISPGMLKRAEQKIEKNGWGNVEIICADITERELSVRADAALFCLVLSLIPDHENVLAGSMRLLKKGSPVVVVDSWKRHTKWHHRLTNLFIHIKAPFVHSNPNNRIFELLPNYLDAVSVTEELLGVYSIAKGYSR